MLPDGYGAVRRDEVLPLRQVGRRLGFGQTTILAAQRGGLRTIAFGKMKYCIGRDVITFFDRLPNGLEAGK